MRDIESMKHEILGELENLSDTKVLEKMRKFGITPKKAFGVSIPKLRSIAKRIGKKPRASPSPLEY